MRPDAACRRRARPAPGTPAAPRPLRRPPATPRQAARARPAAPSRPGASPPRPPASPIAIRPATSSGTPTATAVVPVPSSEDVEPDDLRGEQRRERERGAVPRAMRGRAGRAAARRRRRARSAHRWRRLRGLVDHIAAGRRRDERDGQRLDRPGRARERSGRATATPGAAAARSGSRPRARRSSATPASKHAAGAAGSVQEHVRRDQDQELHDRGHVRGDGDDQRLQVSLAAGEAEQRRRPRCSRTPPGPPRRRSSTPCSAVIAPARASTSSAAGRALRQRATAATRWSATSVRPSILHRAQLSGCSSARQHRAADQASRRRWRRRSTLAGGTRQPPRRSVGQRGRGDEQPPDRRRRRSRRGRATWMPSPPRTPTAGRAATQASCHTVSHRPAWASHGHAQRTVTRPATTRATATNAALARLAARVHERRRDERRGDAEGRRRLGPPAPGAEDHVAAGDAGAGERRASVGHDLLVVQAGARDEAEHDDAGPGRGERLAEQVARPLRASRAAAVRGARARCRRRRLSITCRIGRQPAVRDRDGDEEDRAEQHEGRAGDGEQMRADPALPVRPRADAADAASASPRRAAAQRAAAQRPARLRAGGPGRDRRPARAPAAAVGTGADRRDRGAGCTRWRSGAGRGRRHRGAAQPPPSGLEPAPTCLFEGRRRPASRPLIVAHRTRVTVIQIERRARPGCLPCRPSSPRCVLGSRFGVAETALPSR